MARGISEKDYQQMLRQPSIWDGYRGMKRKAGEPHGHQGVITEPRPDPLSGLPDVPPTGGTFIFLGAVYPLLMLDYSLFEYYHSQGDVDIRPTTYVTREEVIRLLGTAFHDSPMAHRLHWLADSVAADTFLGFVRSLVFKRNEKRKAWALECHKARAAWPDDSNDRKAIDIVYVMPYRCDGAFEIRDQPGIHLRSPLWWWRNINHIAAKKKRAEACKRMLLRGAPVGQVDDFYAQAEELAAVERAMGWRS